MQLPAIVFAALPVISTFLGGYVVLRWKRDLHPWLSLSGGILLGVAFLDLLPEALERGNDVGLETTSILSAILIAIVGFHVLDKIFAVHEHHEHAHGEPEEHCDNERHRKTKAWVRAFGMILHSLCDGLAIGGGFAVNYQLGFVIALAVVMHDFSDGMSTVTILKSALGHKDKSIVPMLILDALAPFTGSLIGMALAPNPAMIALLLAGFAGFFIFLSLSELLPQAHSGNLARHHGVALTIIGILAVVFITHFASV